ncbi:hypothetical protein PCASD_21105 [Puccinia coronata f. sp. avenae]|uniref:Uncharacterized protein n=1 Tax=Puccinia coronata f. sp. avenae TaxID=200324 RepID=A0A2N5T261_9BASI|nr:hypothetical protein PCASD_21105 [Puccinia coronata f. sp. avenae]
MPSQNIKKNTAPTEDTHALVMPRNPDGVVVSGIEALHTHIRVLWDLRPRQVPPPGPLGETLREFYHRFENAQQVQEVADNMLSATAIIPASEVKVLQDVRLGRRFVGSGIITIDKKFVKHVQSFMAAIGLRFWRPNLAEARDSLLNLVCRISAIETFQKCFAAGSYRHMDVNLWYVDNINTLNAIYNFFVHHIATEQSKKKVNRTGQHDGRGILDIQSDCKAIIQDSDSHSDDEYDEETKGYIIKKLPFRSYAANIFFRRLDPVMLTAAQQVGGTAIRTRVLLATPQLTMFPEAPKLLPLDFYDPKWFNTLESS